MTEKDIDRIAEKVVEKLKTNQKNDYYKETEAMLRAYPNYKLMVEKNNERIQDILKNGIGEERKTSNNDVRVQGGIVEYKGLPEIELEKIEHLKLEHLKLEKRIMRVDNALIHIEKDQYFDIIVLRYFKNWTIEEIADKMNVSVRTIGSNRTRLIKKLEFALFPEFNLDKTIF